MRAFGVCQPTFAFESMMDLLAEKLAMDPLDFRLLNALSDGDTNCAGVRLVTSTGVAGCLEILRVHPFWLEREESAPMGVGA